MKNCKGTYYVTVIEDTQTGAIVGCASLIIEQKFIHSTATVSVLMPLPVYFNAFSFSCINAEIDLSPYGKDRLLKFWLVLCSLNMYVFFDDFSVEELKMWL